MLGTIVNVAVIVIGSTAGLLLGNRLPQKTQETTIYGLGLISIVIGLQMALQTRNILIVMFSILLGGIIGEALALDDHLKTLGNRIETAINRRTAANDADDATRGRHSISRAFVTASLIFCVGPMATLGPIQDGLLGDSNLLMIKSSLDLFCSMALSASLGVGVIISAASVLVYQGGLAVITKLLGSSLGVPPASDAPAIIEMTAAGGIMIIGIGLELLSIKTIRITNLLPAIVLAPLFVVALHALGIL